MSDKFKIKIFYPDHQDGSCTRTVTMIKSTMIKSTGLRDGSGLARFVTLANLMLVLFVIPT